MQLKVKRLDPAAIIPSYATPGAACFDLHALHCGSVHGSTPTVFRTGLAFDIPEGWVLKVYSRSGHAFRHNVRLSNCVGIIDADYTGELMVKLACDQEFGRMDVAAGDRIAQAMLERVERVEFVEVDDLKVTERGAGGFGSTGK